MIITKLFPSGAYEIAEVISGFLVRRTYMGLSKREANREFRNEFPRGKSVKQKGTQ